MPGHKVYDAIVAGAGPGGSSAAALLARQGLSVLLLDKAEFPRDKICGDGLTPQALYWLDVLGCAGKVLDQTNSCITACDLYVDGQRILTGRFPQDGPYPGFCTLLTRRKLDSTLAAHAVAQGAEFKPGHRVHGLDWEDGNLGVVAEAQAQEVRFRGRLLIGADGASSVVSRAIGNDPRQGTVALSQRAYYQGVHAGGSRLQVYFDHRFFPGYGWVFVDDSGLANVGLGYASDRTFGLRPRRSVKEMFSEFVGPDLPVLTGATPVGRPAGWWACFSRPRAMVADRVMLVGDAAHLADPLNGGGIHKAIESAHAAAQVAVQALGSGDCSVRALGRYEQLWRQRAELNWRAAELFLAMAKNPNLRELYLALLRALGRLTAEDQEFQDFCSAFFVDTISRSTALSPLVLLQAIPLDPGAWLSLLGAGNSSGLRAPLELALAVLRGTFQAAGRMATSPRQNLSWGLEILTRATELLGGYAGVRLEKESWDADFADLRR